MMHVVSALLSCLRPPTVAHLGPRQQPFAQQEAAGGPHVSDGETEPQQTLEERRKDFAELTSQEAVTECGRFRIQLSLLTDATGKAAVADRVQEAAVQLATFSGASLCSFLADSGSRPSGEPRLTVLASGGAAAHAVPVGLQLPGLAAAGEETHSSSDHDVPLTLPLGPQSSQPAAAANLRTEAGGHLPQAPLPLPPCWSRLLQRIQAVTGGRPPSSAVLVPLLLGSRRVGLMLLVLPPSGPKLKQPQLRLSAPGALEALGACVAECCLGPVLPAVEQAAAAAAAVSSAASLSELATALTSALNAALSAQLHVDLTVRLAVLPYKEARAGVLFSTASAAYSKPNAKAQPPSPSDRAAAPRPLGAPADLEAGKASPARAVQSSRALAPKTASLSSWLLRSSTQATLRGATPPPSFAHRSRDASAVSGSAAAAEDAPSGGGPISPRGDHSRRSIAFELDASGSLPAAGPPPALTMTETGSCVGSINLESVLSAGRSAVPQRPRSPGAPGGPTTAAQRTAWKACPFTSAATLLAALLSGLAGAEPTSPCASQLSPAAPGSEGAAGAVAKRGSSGAPMELRAQVVADVPAFLHDPERPSKDLFSLARRAGGAGGVASLLAISAAWAAPAGLLLSRGAAEGGPGAPAERGDAAELPALGLYVYSALPLPQSLLAAAQGHAAGLLKVLAPGVMRALASGGPVADQWAVLRGQALGATAAHLPSSSRLFSDGASRGGGGSAMILSTGAETSATEAFQALIVNARTQQAFAPLAPVLPPTAELLPTHSTARLATALTAPPLINTGAATASIISGGAGCGGCSISAPAVGATARPLGRGASSSRAPDAAAAAAASAGSTSVDSGGRTALGPGQLRKRTASLRHSTTAPLTTEPPSARGASTSASASASPSASASTNGRSLLALLNSALGRSTNPRLASGEAAAMAAAAELPGGGDGYLLVLEPQGSADEDVLAMLTASASDLGAAVSQHQQLATLVSAFTTTLARSRTAADMHASAHAEADMRALSITHAIGQGACSVVMQGRMHAMSVAVKVILPLDADDEETGASATSRPDPAKERGATLRRRKRLQALVRSARELAVLTSISHPNIVQVYSYCTRVVVEEPQPGRPRLRGVPEGEEAEVPFSTALIMECCDMGSLADAIDSGLFYQAARRAAAVARAQRPATGGNPSPVAQAAAMSTAGTPALRAAYLTLLEVALALRHLHSLNLVHCDVKPANVLLRSSATDPRGFTAKLTDFGFVSLVPSPATTDREGGVEPSAPDPVGTITHMAPELFVSGTIPESSIDCYAFGILMWEIYTGRAPYAKFAATDFAEVPALVAKEGLRPRFPPDTPLLFKQLARECWSAAPSQRPTATALVTRLQALMDASSGGGGGGGAE